MGLIPQRPVIGRTTIPDPPRLALDRAFFRMVLTLSLLVFIGLIGCDSAQTQEESLPIHETSQPTVSSLQKRFTDDAGHPRVTEPGSEAPTIVAFGDSLTAGLGVAQDLSYPAQLQHRLTKAGYAYRVINAGVNGDTTAGGLRRVDWVLKSQPSIVILELGANDGLRGLPLEDMSSNLERIIQRLQAEGVIVILAGMKIPPNYGADYTSRFADMYPTLAQRYRLELIEFFLEGVAAIPSLNQGDGIHPTAEGYARVVENVLPVLTPILKP